MKFLAVSFFSFLCFFSFSQGKIQIDKIVAQVGENIILQSDIDAQKKQMIQSGFEIKEGTDCQVLEDIMFQELLINQAKIDSVEITDAQVDSEMESRLRMIEQQIGSRAKMEEFYGKTATQMKIEFRPVIRKKMIAEEMQRRITENITVTPKEIEAFFKKIPVDSIPLINSQLSFQQIVAFPEVTKDDKELARVKLQNILDGIKKGKDFESEARKWSEDPGSASKGGIMNASKGMMVPRFEAAIFALKEGEVSEVFETEFGFHIAKMIKRMGDDYICSHILIIPTFNRESLIKASNRIEECYNKLKQNEITWDNAVLQYSNDDNTKQNRGIITNPITGEQTWSSDELNQVDQQIYLLTDALNKGDISSPSLYFDYNERKQGVRIVRLMERTTPHRANLQDDYSLIQNAALSDKKQRILNEWVENKIKNAYIRIDQKHSLCNFESNWVKKTNN